MSALRARMAQRRGEGGFVIMAGLAVWMLVGGVVMTALLGMTLSVAQQARMQRERSQAARAVDGALEVGVTQLQVDRTGKKGVPTGKGDGSCRAGVGSNGGDLVVEAGTDPVVVTAVCTGPAAADQVHRVVLTASAKGSGVVGSAALAVVAAPGGGNDVVVDSWTVDDGTAVTTTTVAATTTVKPTTTTSTTTTSTTTTVKPTTTTSTSTTTTTTAPSGVTWAIKIQSDWGTGYCADVTVSNPTKAAIDWTVRIPIEGKPYTVWNANWSQSGQVLVASGVDWNRTVQPGGTQPFGFCNNR